ncbi:MAG: hypothetical protein QNJ45_17050 [Ardenticatenaceae bacterium]|nr:hypothetical protein [Ardenticatenaceae bacterium]
MTVVSVQQPQPELVWGQKLFLGFIYLLTLSPWIWILGLVLLVSAAFIEVGDFPSFGNPDPSSIVGWSILVEPLQLLFAVNLAIPFLLFLVLLVALRYLPVKYYRRPLPYYLIGQAFFLMLPLAQLLEQAARGYLENIWLLVVILLPFLGITAFAAWDDVFSYRWTRWTAAAVVWGFSYAILASLAEQLIKWLIG